VFGVGCCVEPWPRRRHGATVGIIEIIAVGKAFGKHAFIIIVIIIISSSNSGSINL